MNRLKLSLLTLAAALPAASVLVGSAAGPNLLQNADFSSGVAGWSNMAGNPQAVNGAMQLTNTYQGTGNSYYSALQCVDGVQAGVNYTVTGDAFVALGQPLHTGAGIYLHFRTGPNCTGSNLGGGHAAAAYTDAERGIWVPLNHSVTAPAGAVSVHIRPTAIKEPQPHNSSIPGTFVALFDNLSFFETNGPNQQPPIDDPSDAPPPVEEDTPEPPETPGTPDVPEIPEVPQTPDVPQIPEVPQVPDVPAVPEVPQTPEVPETPQVPETPEVPQTPEAPKTPAPQPTPAPPQPQEQEEPEVPAEAPLPPSTGNGIALAGPGALALMLATTGAALAGIASVTLAASIRRR